MDTKIVEIAGRTYLELPCRPGTRVYYVGYQLDADDIGSEGKYRLMMTYGIYDSVLHTLDEVLRYMDRIGKDMFLTKEEAEEYKRKVEAGECTL